MSKYILSIVTEMEFENRESLDVYLDDPGIRRTGMDKEIAQAVTNNCRLYVRTPRPAYGVTTTTHITAQKIERIEDKPR